MAFTTTDLIAQIKRIAHVPTNQNTFQAVDFLALADLELRTRLLPLIMGAREEFYVTNKDYTLVSGTSHYRLPVRAIGGKVKDVVLVDGNGQIFELVRLFSEDLKNLSVMGTGVPYGFYFQNNDVVLVPGPANVPYTLRVPYFIRPSRLVATTAAAQITAIDTLTNIVTFSTIPATITTSTPVDFVKNDPGFESVQLDVTPTAVTTTTITFSSLPTGLAVGDWVALAGESPVPQVPVEFQEILAHAVATNVMRDQGDGEGYKIAKDDLKEMLSAAKGLISPRADGQAKKIVNYTTTIGRRNRIWK